MCHRPDGHPPELPSGRRLPPLAGGTGAEWLTVPSADGTAVDVALTESPAGESRAAVLIFPDAQGLGPYYAELAERFAAAGHHAIAFDYFTRTAPLPRDAHFDRMAAIAGAGLDEIQADAAAAIALLKARTGCERVVAVGFCFGGTNTYLAAANRDLDLAGYVAFYGGLDASRLTVPSPPDVAAGMRGPVLGLFGGADQSISAGQVAGFDALLDEYDVDHQFVTYPGAPHGFFDRRFAEHAAACGDAWNRVLDFLRAA